ncbi:MAG: methionine biosynthesis protein MetW [bacterium]
MFYFFGGLLLWYCLIFVYKTKTGSPSVPSRDEHIRSLVKYVKPGMRVADLGCGDGRVLLAMVRAGAKSGEGWEIEPWVWLSAILKVRKAKLEEKIQIHFGDMWRTNLKPYDLVFVYQLTRYAPRFVNKCRAEMRKETLVVANTYPLEGLELIKKDKELLIYKI